MNWRKILGWAAAISAVFVLLVAGAGYLTLRSPSFHKYVLAKIIQKAQEKTGANIELGDYTIHLAGRRLDLYRLTIHGTEPPSAKPLFTADHLGVGLKIISVLRRKVDLSEIILDRPVVHLSVDPNGRMNLPRPPTQKSATPSTDIFDLAIGRVVIAAGELYYNDRKTPLDAELFNLQAQSGFNALRGEYRGSLGYSRGKLIFKHSNPFEHSLNVHFVAARGQLVLDPIFLSSGGSNLSFCGTLNDYANPSVHGTYQLVLATQELRKTVKNSLLPSGQVAMNGSLLYESEPNRSFLEAVYADGQLSSAEMAARTPQAAAQVRSLRGKVVLQNGNLEAKGLQAEVFGGRVSANLEMRHLASTPDSHLTAAAQGVSLKTVSDALRSARLKRLPLVGRVDAKADAKWVGGLQNLRAQADANLSASLDAIAGQGSNAQRFGVPLDGMIHIGYDGPRNLISLDHSYLRARKTDIQLTGTLSDHSNVRVLARTTDLHEVDVLAVAVESVTAQPSGGQPADPNLLGLHGAATFDGHLTGSTKAPRLVGQLFAGNLTVEESRWRLLRTNVDASPSAVAFRNGDLESFQAGHITFDVSAGLHDWSFTQTSAVSARVVASRMSISDLQQLARSRYPVSGILNANISVQGSLANPTGQGSAHVTQARISDEPVKSVSLQFRGTGNSIHANAHVMLPAGGATVTMDYSPPSQSYDAQLNIADIRLDRLQNVQRRNLPIAGTLVASAQGHGTLKQPQLDATLAINHLQISNQAVPQFQAQLNVANQQANFTLDSQIADGFVQAKGNVKLSPDYYTTASLDTRAFPLGPLFATYLPGQAGDLQGQTELHASLKGPLKDVSHVQGQLELPTLNLAYKSLQISNAGPIRVKYESGIAELAPAELKGTGTDLHFQGTVPVQSQAPLNFQANGTADLALIRAFASDLDSSGKADLNFSARGDKAHLEVQGNLRIVNAAFSSSSSPMGLEKINGQLQIQSDRIQITQLTGEAGGGTIAAQGSLAYRPQMAFNLGLAANSIRLRYPQGVRAILDGKIALTGTSQDSTLSGQVSVDRLSFTNEFDLASFMGQFSDESPTPSSTAFEQNMRLNIAVQSAQQLALASSKVSVQGSTNLRVTGTAANPVILGRTTLTGGELFFLGNRYEIQNGVINFANPVRTEPVVNLNVATRVKQYNITLNFVGPVDRLRTTYISDPGLPPADIINLLAFGKTTEEAATSPSTPASLGAESVVAQRVSGTVSGQVEKLAGISQLQIDPLVGGDQRDPGARLALQQHITSNILFSFSTDVTATQREIIRIEYQTKRKLGISVLRDENGGFAVDAHIRKAF